MKNLIILNIATCRYVTKNLNLTSLRNGMWDEPANQSWDIIKFKFDLEFEDYLFFKVHKMHRSLLAQFRAGMLPLSVEVDRYRNIPMEERLCTLCDDNIVEDEILFFVFVQTL